jgi:choline dehydrogenase-like flavoprotein
MPGRASGASYDAIVVGSGFGGAFIAHALVEAGARVVMLERGSWVERGPHNWGPQGSIEASPYYCRDTTYRVVAGSPKPELATYSCVGGPSVFFGGVALRFRPGDFEPPPEIVGDSAARWPFGYGELAPWYDRAEAMLAVAGEPDGSDPHEPPRYAAYPQPAAPLSGTSRMIADAGRALGLRPSRLPLAIQHTPVEGRNACVACGTCDTFACAISAKNDLATTILPRLMKKGMDLKARTLVTSLVTENGRVAGVETVDKDTGARERLAADMVVAAAGALGSAHLLLASGLAAKSPAGETIGRYLTRHCSAIQFGLFPRLPDGGRTFHKQIGFFDYYYGDPRAPEGGRKLGCLQQVQSPSPDLVRGFVSPLVGLGVIPLLSHLTGLLVMAEDEPRRENRVWVEPGRTDRFGLPELQVEHRYTARDLLARDALMARAREILKEAGAFFYKKHIIWTFSHAAGTVRMGDDAKTAPLDRFCRFRGVDGLYVVDASFMPTGGGVNPSLTIAANALRVGDAIVRGERAA